MDKEKSAKPCHYCPEDCARHNETCKVYCKIYKVWAKDHKTPPPRVSAVDAYTMQKHHAIKRRLKNAKR